MADINTAVNALTIEDFFGAQSTGALSLIGGDTKLKDVPQAISDAVSKSTLYDLCDAGLLGSSITREKLNKDMGGGKMLGDFNIVTIIEYIINMGI